MKILKNIFRNRRNIALSDRQMRAADAREAMWDHSPAPWILTVTLVWIVSSVLLVLSLRQSSGAAGLTAGNIAIREYRVPADFTIPDRKGNEQQRKAIREKEPFYFRMLPERSNEILRNFIDLFNCMENRYACIRARRIYEPLRDSLPSRLAATLSMPLLGRMERDYRNSRSLNDFMQLLRLKLQNGIMPTAEWKKAQVDMAVRTIDEHGRVNLPCKAGSLGDAATVAETLSQQLFPENVTCRKELAAILLPLLGDGNLAPDTRFREAEIIRAERNMEPRILRFHRNEVLIKPGQAATPELLQIIREAEKAAPPQFQPVILYRLGLSFGLLFFTIFYLYKIHPDLMQENRRIEVAGAAVIFGLAVNYAAIAVFHLLFAPFFSGIAPLALMLFVPASLTAGMLTILWDYRSGLCCGTLVTVLTVLMLAPETPMELILRYLTISALAAMVVRNVTNYRSYFVRIFFAAGVLGMLLFADKIGTELLAGIRTPGQSTILMQLLLLLWGGAFGSAVLSLVAVFSFELLFNISTNMALMVLCDYNHPLLERMKREAPGTLFHSMTVSTLAEDAARAIHANPLKAKAGALFHDIGKLIDASYFTENNRNSSELHRQLSPQASAAIIRGHVTEGMRLARAWHLCRLAREAIRTHHGDGLIYFFYAKAQAESADPVSVNAEDFRYSGVPPRGKELTIISLADVCEAASRSLEKPTPESIRKLVNELFVKRWNEGQLRNSALSLREFDLVRESFISTLNNIHHGRIAYTTEAINEAAASQMEQSPASRPAAH